MVLDLVVELGGRAELPILRYPEGVVVVAGVDLEREGAAVHRGVVIVVPNLELEYQVTLWLVLLGDDGKGQWGSVKIGRNMKCEDDGEE